MRKNGKPCRHASNQARNWRPLWKEVGHDGMAHPCGHEYRKNPNNSQKTMLTKFMMLVPISRQLCAALFQFTLLPELIQINDDT